MTIWNGIWFEGPFLNIITNVATFWIWILNVPTIRWWSEPMFAPLLLRKSSRDLLHCLLMHMWSTWFWVILSGDTQVRQSWCGIIVPPIRRLLLPQSSTKSSPLSFISPTPCFIIGYQIVSEALVGCSSTVITIVLIVFDIQLSFNYFFVFIYLIGSNLSHNIS